MRMRIVRVLAYLKKQVNIIYFLCNNCSLNNINIIIITTVTVQYDCYQQERRTTRLSVRM